MSRSTVHSSWLCTALIWAVLLTGCANESDSDFNIGPGDRLRVVVSGVVVNSNTGNAVGEAEVSAYHAGDVLDRQSVGSDGAYELLFGFEQGEAPDKILLEAQAEGYEEYEVPVGVERGIEYDFELVPMD